MNSSSPGAEGVNRISQLQKFSNYIYIYTFEFKTAFLTFNSRRFLYFLKIEFVLENFLKIVKKYTKNYKKKLQDINQTDLSRSTIKNTRSDKTSIKRKLKV